MESVLIAVDAGFINLNFVHYIPANVPDVRKVNFDALTYAGSLDNLKNPADEKRRIFCAWKYLRDEYLRQLVDES